MAHNHEDAGSNPARPTKPPSAVPMLSVETVSSSDFAELMRLADEHDARDPGGAVFFRIASFSDSPVRIVDVVQSAVEAPDGRLIVPPGGPRVLGADGGNMDDFRRRLILALRASLPGRP